MSATRIERCSRFLGTSTYSALKSLVSGADLWTFQVFYSRFKPSKAAILYLPVLGRRACDSNCMQRFCAHPQDDNMQQAKQLICMQQMK